MARAFKSLFLVVLAAAVIVVLYQLVLFGLRLNNALSLAQESAAFQMLQPQATLNILIVGDSTAVGTGASLPSASLAGRIAQHYPCASLVNRAQDGAITEDVVAQIDGTGNAPFDLLLVQAGAKDVLRFTDLDGLRRDITETLSRAIDKADHVVFVGTGNLGPAPIFPPLLDSIYGRRSREVRQVFIEAADAAGVQYVDLLKVMVNGRFAKDPRKYYAPDYLHPSSDGYALWYKALISQSDMESVLDC